MLYWYVCVIDTCLALILLLATEEESLMPREAYITINGIKDLLARCFIYSASSKDQCLAASSSEIADCKRLITPRLSRPFQECRERHSLEQGFGLSVRCYCKNTAENHSLSRYKGLILSNSHFRED